ncbi:MAG: hypothetical protein VB127_00900, partial [Sphaerochaeta sp.]|nr:hypothetical protein [Sphaerochaeta sp.]
MEFDKSKILTVVTADQAKVGQKGWFGDELCALMRMVLKCKPMTVRRIEPEFHCRRFMTDQDIPFALFYPAPEPTYAERQAQWVRENNVKEGTKVRVTRTFTEDEDGSCCWEHDDLVGKTGIIQNICPHNLGIDMNDGNFRAIPYFALEVIKEPTYRPFKNDELNDLVGKVLIQKNTGNAMMAIKVCYGEVGKLISL